MYHYFIGLFLQSVAARLVKEKCHPFFSWPAMIIRSCLTAIDHNTSVDRSQAKTRDGTLRYKFNVSST